MINRLQQFVLQGTTLWKNNRVRVYCDFKLYSSKPMLISQLVAQNWHMPLWAKHYITLILSTHDGAACFLKPWCHFSAQSNPWCCHFLSSPPLGRIHQRSGLIKVSLLVTAKIFSLQLILGIRYHIQFADMICWWTDIMRSGVCVCVHVCDVQVGKMDFWTESTVHWIYRNVQNKWKVYTWKTNVISASHKNTNTDCICVTFGKQYTLGLFLIAQR